MTRVQEFWQHLSDRDRAVLGVGIICCILFIFYSLCYSPLMTAVEKKTSQFTEQAATLTWMQSAQVQYKSAASTEKINRAQLLTVVAKQLNTGELQQFTYQLQQTATQDIELSFERVPFNIFVQWLWHINQKYPFIIKMCKVENTNIQGVVKLNLVLSVN